MSNTILGLKPLQFVHILDLNSNITRLEVGPQTVPLKTNETLVTQPLPMVIVKPGYYCIIKDPCSNYIPGEASELKIGQTAVKFNADSPFPLYPGETLLHAPDFLRNRPDYSIAIKPLPVIQANHAIRLVANVDFEDVHGKHQAGDKWQLEGPVTYRPQPEAEVEGIIKPVVIRQGESLKLKATQEFTDRFGKKRVTGEEWMINKPGAYLPDVYEEVVSVQNCITLTPNNGIFLQALQTMVDSQGIKRMAGEQWLLTGAEADHYFPEIGVEVTSAETIKVLWRGQYCVIKDVVDKKGKPQLSKRELRVGPCSFFLHPGESLEKGVQNVHILGEDDAIVLQAEEEYRDLMFKGKRRSPGDVWMLRGPLEYIPPIEVRVIKTRTKIPLSKNEGIYIKDLQTGKVRAEMGPKSYMLSEFEELWEKDLPAVTEELLKQGGGLGTGDIRKMAYFEQSIDPHVLAGRNKTRVVTYRCPGNTAVQVYNYLEKTARVVFGPDLVILGPHENFNVLSLSAGKPKKSNSLKSLCLMLGPDFITDILEVETSDHARLRIQVAFNNHFEYDLDGPEEEKCKLFAVPDFIGFASKQMGARIRAAVAQVTFDDFHRHSNQVLTTAVFGLNAKGQMNNEVRFPENNLVLSSMDIQSIEPVDVKMRDSLSKSVQLAIEISTNSIEAAASHEAARNEQIARGELERQKLYNEKEAEKERTKLLELQAITAAVESTGQAKAEAQAQAERIIIECESEIEAARLRAEAAEIEHNAQLAAQESARNQELQYTRNMNELEVHKEKEMANIEVKRFGDMISSIGANVLKAIATAGPANQVNLLKALGMESVLITDGNSPINLFNTANGIVGENN
ncbi:major vault protein-like [Saccostrea echinata]|uniref:major vault protein-like n=1 Tax=Saccostrea echinata TaxID=191078 RepID=UPI002A8036D1|nr:major vault protein-like [Saccostrea echinata]